jgi:N-acetylmuramoyl-L-alanine amidase
MRIFRKIALIAGLQLLSVAAIAAQAQVEAVQFLANANSAKVVFNVSTTVTKGVFLLDNPARLVIDLKDTKADKALPQPSPNHPLFSKVRSGTRNDTDLRVVVDLKKPFAQKDLKVTADKTGQIVVSVLTGENTAPVREKIEDKAINEESKAKNPIIVAEAETKVVDASAVAENEAKTIEAELASELESEAGVAESEHKFLAKTDSKKNKEIIVAIDAGHGGIDAGAQGPNGTQEKRVVFAIAKRLAQLINDQPGMRAVMVRKGDYYIKLRERMEIARQAKADLFVSIHADAIKDRSVKGASVYTLSNHGASSEAARWLANSENAADLIGGVSLDDKDDVLASVLLDLSQSATKEASRSVAGKILKYFDAIGKLHKNEVQKAGFMVLKSPDIPSILIETAFISNPNEEMELRSGTHQEKVATAVFKGIASYFREYAPAGTRMASSQ